MPLSHIGIVAGKLADGFLGAKSATPPPGTMPSSTAARVAFERVLDAILLLLDFDFRRAADADHRDAAGKFGQPLLQLLAVVVEDRFLDLLLDLRHPGFDVLLLAGAVDDGGFFLLDHHLLGAAEHRHVDVLELDAEVFGDQLAAGEDGDVFEHGLAAVAKAWSLHRRDLQAAAQLIDHQRGKRFAFDVFGDDQYGLPDCTTASSTGSNACSPGSFFSCSST